MNLAHLLRRAARLRPDAPAIAVGRAVVRSYGELGDRVARLADGLLRKLALGRGERVAIAMKNCPEYLEVLFACWHAGLVAVPMNAKLHPKEFAYILDNSGARACFVTPDLEAAIPQALPLSEIQSLKSDANPPVDAAPGDPAWLFYTSGTTGVPKGAVLTHGNLLFQTHAYFADIDKLEPGDAVLHPAPLSHGSGLYHLPYVLQGATNVVPRSGGFEPAEVFALAAHWRHASFFAAPTMVRRLVDHAKAAGLRPEGLSTICYGGGPMYLADIEEALAVVGPHFAQIYGQGESPMTISVLPRHVIDDRTHPRWRERLASVGYAQPMVELSIRAGDGTPLPTGETGEVCVRGDVVMEGYWQQPEATAAAIRDGWLWTGDVGRLDAEGYLTLLDRSKDLIISGGANIYPREVEEALLAHPALREAGVIGRPDPEWGEIVVAYVVRGAPVSEAELDAHCLERIARFKRPKLYRFVDALPKNHYGKVLKTELRERDRRDPLTPPPAPAPGPR